MEKLKTSQVARISSVIVEAASNIGELSFVYDGCQQGIGVSKTSAAVVSELEDILELEIEFETASEDKDKSYYHGIKYDDAKQKLNLKIRNVCRGLRELGYPLSRGKDAEYPEEKMADEVTQFAKCLEQLHAYVQYDLSKTSEQQDLSAKHERRVTERTEAAEAEAKFMSEQLFELKTQRDTEGRRNAQKIYALEAEIDSVSKSLREEREEIFSKSKRTLLEGEALMAEKRAETEESLEKAMETRNALRSSTSDEEDHLHRKIRVATRKVNELIQKYDDDMTRKFAMLRHVEKLHQDETQRLAELQEYYRRIDRDLANEREEERLIAEEKAQIAAEQAALDDAAARIQSRFRGMLTRKKLKKKKKKKGKGKNKKKKR